MKAYSYEFLAVVLVLLGSILFSTLGLADNGNALAGDQGPREPNAEVVSLK